MSEYMAHPLIGSRYFHGEVILFIFQRESSAAEQGAYNQQYCVFQNSQRERNYIYNYIFLYILIIDIYYYLYVCVYVCIYMCMCVCVYLQY